MATTNEQIVDPYKPLTIGKNQRIVLTSATPFTPAYVQSHMHVSDPASLYEARVKGRHVPLVNPVKESAAKEKKRKQLEMKKSAKKALARGQCRKGGWKIEKDAERFDLFVPLHRLWMGYMSELLGLPPPPSLVSSSLSSGDADEPRSRIPNSSSMHPKLVKADFHGSIVTVRASRNPCLVGLSGIVLYESENAFQVITKANRLKLIPKQHSIFTLAIPLYSTLDPASPGAQTALHTWSYQEPPSHDKMTMQPSLSTVFDMPHMELELYGNQFLYRSTERAGRKFKAKETIEL